MCGRGGLARGEIAGRGELGTDKGAGEWGKGAQARMPVLLGAERGALWWRGTPKLGAPVLKQKEAGSGGKTGARLVAFPFVGPAGYIEPDGWGGVTETKETLAFFIISLREGRSFFCSSLHAASC
jgi:hypothetical protein